MTQAIHLFLGETKEGVDCDRPKSCIISQRNLVSMSGTSPKISSYTKNHMTFEGLFQTDRAFINYVILSDYVATPLPIFHFVFWLFVVASSVFMASLWTSYGRVHSLPEILVYNLCQLFIW